MYILLKVSLEINILNTIYKVHNGNELIVMSDIEKCIPEFTTPRYKKYSKYIQ